MARHRPRLSSPDFPQPPAPARAPRASGGTRRPADSVLDEQRERRARERLEKWGGQDLTRAWTEWWDAAQHLLTISRQDLDPRLFTLAVRFVSTVMQLASLLHHVHLFRGQTGQIEKAAEALGYTKPSGYNWIKWAGLDSADVLNAADDEDFDRAMSRLIAKGDTIGLLLDEVMEQSRKMRG